MQLVTFSEGEISVHEKVHNTVNNLNMYKECITYINTFSLTTIKFDERPYNKVI